MLGLQGGNHWVDLSNKKRLFLFSEDPNEET